MTSSRPQILWIVVAMLASCGTERVEISLGELAPEQIVFLAEVRSGAVGHFSGTAFVDATGTLVNGDRLFIDGVDPDDIVVAAVDPKPLFDSLDVSIPGEIPPVHTELDSYEIVERDAEPAVRIGPGTIASPIEGAMVTATVDEYVGLISGAFSLRFDQRCSPTVYPLEEYGRTTAPSGGAPIERIVRLDRDRVLVVTKGFLEIVPRDGSSAPRSLLLISDLVSPAAFRAVAVGGRPRGDRPIVAIAQCGGSCEPKFAHALVFMLDDEGFVTTAVRTATSVPDFHFADVAMDAEGHVLLIGDDATVFRFDVTGTASVSTVSRTQLGFPCVSEKDGCDDDPRIASTGPNQWVVVQDEQIIRFDGETWLGPEERGNHVGKLYAVASSGGIDYAGGALGLLEWRRTEWEPVAPRFTESYLASTDCGGSSNGRWSVSKDVINLAVSGGHLYMGHDDCSALMRFQLEADGAPGCVSMLSPSADLGLEGLDRNLLSLDVRDGELVVGTSSGGHVLRATVP
jgi:hypothetical protein